MNEPLEERVGRKLEPVVLKRESKLCIRSQALLIFALTALWWLCRHFLPADHALKTLEIFRMAVAMLCPVATFLLTGALLVSASKSGWLEKGWIFPSVLCALSPWAVAACGYDWL